MTEDHPPGTAAAPEGRQGLHKAIAYALWAAVFVMLWLILSGPDSSSWIIGVPAVLGAVWAKSRLSDNRIGSLSPLGVIRSIPFFLWESLKGGTDVALRVLGPQVRVNPGYLDYRLRLRRPSARVLFMDVVNLLPGTLTADVQGDRATIHTLDRRGDPMRSLMALEERVAALFGEPLAASWSAPP
jgi:multicomponent Na+:H+ antiporter subunit E